MIGYIKTKANKNLKKAKVREWSWISGNAD